MMFRLALAALALAAQARSCEDGVSCRDVAVNGMTFACAYAGESDNSGGDVFLLHGNDGVTKERYFELMRELASRGFRSVGCDQRGYSPGASPQVYAAYNYDELAADIFAIADASGFGRFHVVAHDQGARLSWHAIAANAGRERFLSLATLAIPHADAFSEAIAGPLADVRQQTASQYVVLFTLNTTEATKAGGFCLGSGCDFPQRRFWWYNGAIDSGNMALAPVQSYSELIKNGAGIATALQRLRFPDANAAYGNAGVEQRAKVGAVDLPVLYACGLGDSADLCGREYAFANRSKELSNSNAFTYLELPDCGHDVVPCQKTGTAFCEGTVCGAVEGSTKNKVFEAIIANIMSASVAIV